MTIAAGNGKGEEARLQAPMESKLGKEAREKIKGLMDGESGGSIDAAEGVLEREAEWIS